MIYHEFYSRLIIAESNILERASLNKLYSDAFKTSFSKKKKRRKCKITDDLKE
jgi:hypothetical protein